MWEYPARLLTLVCIRAQNEWTVPEVTRFIEIACRSKFGSEKTEYYKQLVIDNDVDGEVIPFQFKSCVSLTVFEPRIPDVSIHRSLYAKHCQHNVFLFVMVHLDLSFSEF